MTLDEISTVLSFVLQECERLGVSSNAYAIGEKPSLEQGELVFSNEDHNWIVFTIERGKRSGEARFSDIMDAVRFFFMKLCVTTPGVPFPKIEFNKLPDRLLYRFD
jgi:hypothetical protein